MKYYDLRDIFSSFKWIFRNEIKTFENNFSNYIGTKYAIGTSYGRTALYLGLRAIDIKDYEVIIPSFVCTVVRHAIVLAGATPVFVDINYDTFEYNLNHLTKKISKKTKAILLIHYYGKVARNLKEIIQISKENNLLLIEDCAHSLGAEYDGQKIGIYGDFSIYSLTKNLLNFGGGVLVTNNDRIYEKAFSILKESKITFKRRVSDFVFVLLYGYEQLLNKVIIDRIRKVPFEKMLIEIPPIVLKLRSYIFRALLPSKKESCSQESKNILSDNLNDSETLSDIGYYLPMEPIIASVGINQLKKIDFFNERRRKLHNLLMNSNHSLFKNEIPPNIKDVNSAFILNFDKENIFNVINYCRQKGFNINATWPTHQNIWDDQKTNNLNKIKQTILFWNINPDISKKELRKITIILEFNSKINNIGDNKRYIRKGVTNRSI